VDVDLSFASEQWQRTVRARTNEGRRIVRRHFECAFSQTFSGQFRVAGLSYVGGGGVAAARLVAVDLFTPAGTRSAKG
jgi:hypothetical protein